MHITVEGPEVEALQLDVQTAEEAGYSLFSSLTEEEVEASENSDPAASAAASVCFAERSLWILSSTVLPLRLR